MNGKITIWRNDINFVVVVCLLVQGNIERCRCRYRMIGRKGVCVFIFFRSYIDKYVYIYSRDIKKNVFF